MEDRFFRFHFVSGILQIALFGALFLALGENLSGVVRWKIPMVIFFCLVFNGTVGLTYGFLKMPKSDR